MQHDQTTLYTNPSADPAVGCTGAGVPFSPAVGSTVLTDQTPACMQPTVRKLLSYFHDSHVCSPGYASFFLSSPTHMQLIGQLPLVYLRMPSGHHCSKAASQAYALGSVAISRKWAGVQHGQSFRFSDRNTA
jgi:hypothetical protein